MATFRWTDGKTYDVPEANVQQALADGFKPVSPEEAAAGDQPGQAALEGAARGATLGFGDKLTANIESQFNQQTPEANLESMRLRRQENPKAAFAGELGGNVALSALTGGGPSALVGGGLKGALLEGGLMGLGSVVSESTLDKSPLTMEKMAAGMAGGALAAGGIHGVLKGAGAAISAGVKKLGGGTLADTFRTAADKAEFNALAPSEKWARNNAERAPELLKFARENGLVSAAGITDEVAAKARALSDSYSPTIGGELDELQNHVPATKELRSEMADAMERSIKSAFGDVGDSPAHTDAIKSAQKYIKSVRSVDRDWRGIWKVQTSLFDDLPRDAAGKPLPAAKDVREKLRQAMRDFVYNEVASGKNKAGSILAGVNPEGKLKTGLPAPEISPRTIRLGEDPVAGGLNLSEAANTTVEGAHPSLAGSSFTKESLHGAPFIRELPLAARPQGVASIEGATSQPGGIFEFPGSRQVPTAEIPGPSPRLDLRPNVSDIAPVTVRLGEEAAFDKAGKLIIDLPAKQSPAWLGAKMRQTGREASMAMALADALEKKSGKLGKGGMFTDRSAYGAMGALATGNLMLAVAGIGADVLKGQVNRRGGFVLGSVLRKLGDSNALNSIATGLQGRIGQVLQMAPAMLGGARQSIEAAFGRGAMDLLAEHVRIASGPDGPRYLASIGLENETPEQVENVGHKLAAMDALHEAQAGLDQRIDLGIDGVLGVKKGPALKYKSPDVSDFQARYDRLKQTVDNPEAAFANAPPELMNGAPSTTATLTAKLLQANQFLLSKAPKDPYVGMPPALKPLWKPAASDVSKWYRYVEAVEQPARMLEKMAQGTFTLEHREALQTVYPALYEDMKARMYDRLAQWEKPLPYGKKAMLSQFFGTQVLGLKPGAFGILQQSFQPKPEDAPPSKGGSRPDGREVIDQDKNALTQAQRIEAKGAEPA